MLPSKIRIIYEEVAAVTEKKSEIAHLHSSAVWQGNLTLPRDSVFEGQLDGRLEVKGRLIIANGSELRGSSLSNALSIQPGAKIQGRVEVKSDAPLKKDFFKIRLF